LEICCCALNPGIDAFASFAPVAGMYGGRSIFSGGGNYRILFSVIDFVLFDRIPGRFMKVTAQTKI